MPAIFDYQHTVVAEEIDALGHVNNLAYLAWMQAAALAHSAAQGWPPENYQRLGFGWVVRSHEITYERAAFLDEDIVVRTWVAGFRRASSVRRYDILRAADGKRLATAATNWAFVNYSNGMPARVPREIIGAFELVGDAPCGDVATDETQMKHG
ncbi:MAG TPA: acyl-CoA thioesterase [Pirellulales bacterium]|jgi:acyl-CoA thioester hydrolase|nr:acyl-CoA thioesterase [Pirellulales bacterium]